MVITLNIEFVKKKDAFISQKFLFLQISLRLLIKGNLLSSAEIDGGVLGLFLYNFHTNNNGVHNIAQYTSKQKNYSFIFV